MVRLRQGNGDITGENGSMPALFLLTLSPVRYRLDNVLSFYITGSLPSYNR